jgi:hypothetical protein
MPTTEKLYEFLKTEKGVAPFQPVSKATATGRHALDGKQFWYYGLDEIDRKELDYTGVKGSNSLFQFQGGAASDCGNDELGRATARLNVREISCYCFGCVRGEWGRCGSRVVAGPAVDWETLTMTQLTTPADERAVTREARRRLEKEYGSRIKHDDILAVQCEEDDVEGDAGFWLAKAIRSLPDVESNACVFEVHGKLVGSGGSALKEGSHALQVRWYERTGTAADGRWTYKLTPSQAFISVATLVQVEEKIVLENASQQGRFLLTAAQREAILGTKW